MLNVCNHPHPFGVVSDRAGRLYIAFSPSSLGGAPLQPLSPTKVMAFEHDGTPLWRALDPMVGGELAAARGLVFPERSDHAYWGGDGGILPLAPGGAFQLGRPTVTLDRLTTSPLAGTFQLFGYDAQTLQPAWTYTLPPGDSFISDQVRLADYGTQPSGSPLSADLLFALRGGQASLMAVDAESGAELWSCPLGYTGPAPQLFEVGSQEIGTMEGAASCGRCDPPFAGSRGLFRTLTVPGLESSSAPWPGAFGGPGHSHHEQF